MGAESSSSWAWSVRESQSCCSELSSPSASALVADLNSCQVQVVIHGDVGLLSVLRSKGLLPSPWRGNNFLLLVVQQGSKFGFLYGTGFSHQGGVWCYLEAKSQNCSNGVSSELACKGRQRLNGKCGIIQTMASSRQSILQAEMTSCKKYPSSKGCVCEDVQIILVLDRLEGCFSHRLKLTKRINLWKKKKMGHLVEMGFHQPCAIVCISQVY